MGYLPEAMAAEKRASFRKNVNRETELPREELLRFHYRAVQHGLRTGGIPNGFMSLGGQKTRKASELFSEAFSHIELPLKGTASTDRLVKEGGKLEDARLLLNLASRFKWRIPVRDLDDNTIIDWLEVVRETDRDEEYTRPLFWISYTVVLNHWVQAGEYSQDYYHRLPMGAEEYKGNFFDARIVHISEPGKERNLTKASAMMGWFLTPGAKLAQVTIAELREHRAGLLESSHEWRHQKRVSVLSDESDFIYDTATGKTMSDVRHVFKDWTESTDFIGKMVGWAHLKGFFEYVGFPRAYARLILRTIIEPQPVTEVVVLRDPEGHTETEQVLWTGFIREGYMMGNPMTKPILHLVHISETQAALEFLRRKGLDFRNPGKGTVVGQPARIDRSLATKCQEFVI